MWWRCFAGVISRSALCSSRTRRSRCPHPHSSPRKSSITPCEWMHSQKSSNNDHQSSMVLHFVVLAWSQSTCSKQTTTKRSLLKRPLRDDEESPSDADGSAAQLTATPPAVDLPSATSSMPMEASSFRSDSSSGGSSAIPIRSASGEWAALTNDTHG